MTIFKYELEKIVKNKTFIGACIVLLMTIFAIVYAGFFQSQLSGIKGNSTMSGENTVEAKINKANYYAGELTDTKVQTIVKDYLQDFQERKGEEKLLFDIFPWYITDLFVTSDEDIYLNMQKALKGGEKVTLNDIRIMPVKDVGFADTGKPIKIGNYMSWAILFEVMSPLFIMIAILVILFCSSIFANDMSKNIVPLLFSTKFGRTKMIMSKILVGTILTVVIFVVVQLIILAIFGLYYGFSGWDVSIQANLKWQIFDFPLGWNNLQVYLFSLGFQMISILFVASLTMFISSISKSTFSAFALSLGIFFLPLGLTYVFKTGIINKILFLFPVNTFEINKTLSLMSRENLFFFESFISNILLVMGIMILGKIIFDVIIYRYMRKSNVASI